MKTLKDEHPYPHKFDVQYSVKEFIEKFSNIEKGKFLEDKVSVGGRVTNIRKQGKKLIFYDLRGDGLKLQVMCNIKNHITVDGGKDF